MTVPVRPGGRRLRPRLSIGRWGAALAAGLADPSCLSSIGPAADEERRLLRASLRLSPLRGLPAVTDYSVSWERDTVDQLRELGYIQ